MPFLYGKYKEVLPTLDGRCIEGGEGREGNMEGGRGGNRGRREENIEERRGRGGRRVSREVHVLICTGYINKNGNLDMARFEAYLTALAQVSE